ncbi:probable transmembrane O-methyltransferase homolog at C-terminar half [Coccomyxa sp. Obi]|nr:probable transmembrane O-methyltransferase homolog at C-terminar half [Coccomyxa sp. Obi]
MHVVPLAHRWPKHRMPGIDFAEYTARYLLPRPLRLSLTGFGSASCLVATVISATRFLSELKYQTGDQDASTVVINLLGFIGFGALFFLDRQAATDRVARREKVRKAQVAIGDREVYTNAEGERMSRLKEVNSDWIIRRLERWGRRDALPFIGPKKGALLQQLVREKQPRLAVEVGALCGYSTLLIAQAMSPDAQLISLESDWKWALVAKRFVYQATTGDKKSKPPDQRIAKVDVWWADALQAFPARFSGKGPIDLLFLDGLPSQYLAYLKAAEPLLAPGALVVADNAGIFGQGGLKEYLEYTRNSGKYSSQYLESTLEWRDDIADGLEVSKLL